MFTTKWTPFYAVRVTLITATTWQIWGFTSLHYRPDTRIHDRRDTGPPIDDETLAILLNDRSIDTKRIYDEKLKANIDSYLRPTNLEELQGTKVKPSTWRKLKADTKSRDIWFRTWQNRIANEFTPLVRTVAFAETPKRMQPTDVTSLETKCHFLGNEI